MTSAKQPSGPLDPPSLCPDFPVDTLPRAELVWMADTLREHALAADLAGARTAEEVEDALLQIGDLLHLCSAAERQRLVRHCHCATLGERADG